MHACNRTCWTVYNQQESIPDMLVHHTWQPLPNTARTEGAVSAAGGICRSPGQVVQATKPPDNGVEAPDGRGALQKQLPPGDSAINFWSSGLFYLQALAHPTTKRGLPRDRRKSKTANRSMAICS